MCSFVITEAEEDREEEEYEMEDKEYEECQKREQELHRQMAESAPLRSRDYDLFADICSHWAREEAPPASSSAPPIIKQALLQLNNYDSEPNSDELVPSASPAVLTSASAGPSSHQD